MSATQWTAKNPSRRKPEHHNSVALMLQGGGALGAYQGGAFEAMAEAGYQPDWVSGISIGAINGAIIAGNRPEERAKKLKEFWYNLATPYDAKVAMSGGVDGFFLPAKNAAAHVAGEHNPLQSFIDAAQRFYGMKTEEPVSMYDPSPMYKRLPEYVDFDYLNNESPTRFSAGAANVKNRMLVYFDRVW